MAEKYLIINADDYGLCTSHIRALGITLIDYRVLAAMRR